MQFFGVSFDPTERTSRFFGRENLERELHDTSVFSWIDVQAEDISALNEVLGSMCIDLVLASQFDAPEVLPRIVERADRLAFYLYEVDDPERHLDTAHGLAELESRRMVVVLGSDFVLTYHRRSLEAVEHVKATCVESFQLAGKTPGFIAFLFLQRCLYDYAQINLANDNYLDLIEGDVLSSDRERLAQQVLVAGRNILALKKLVASLHIVLMLLATKRNRFVSPEARESFREMLTNALAIRAAVDSSRDLLDGILTNMQTAAANRTGDIARTLTVISGILLPLTLITGIYGMNFENMPELTWHFGYFGVLGALLVVGFGLFGIFWRLGWVGSRSR